MHLITLKPLCSSSSLSLPLILHTQPKKSKTLYQISCLPLKTFLQCVKWDQCCWLWLGGASYLPSSQHISLLNASLFPKLGNTVLFVSQTLNPFLPLCLLFPLLITLLLLTGTLSTGLFGSFWPRAQGIMLRKTFPTPTFWSYSLFNIHQLIKDNLTFKHLKSSVFERIHTFGFGKL